MKKPLFMLFLVAFLVPGFAQAALITIGTAGYDSDGNGDPEVYNLIWDNDNNGNSVVWLDYTNDELNWDNQMDWAAGLGNTGVLTINLDGYTLDWVGAWRLPETDNETSGYNITTSEMGHLYYEELGNSDDETGGNDDLVTGPFDYLIPYTYWSGKEVTAENTRVWTFNMDDGKQEGLSKDDPENSSDERMLHGLALHDVVNVSPTDPVPLPSTILLFSVGLAGLAWYRRMNRIGV